MRYCARIAALSLSKRWRATGFKPQMVIIEPTALNNSVRPVVRIILGSVAQSLSQSVVIQNQAELAVVGNSWDFHGE